MDTHTSFSLDSDILHISVPGPSRLEDRKLDAEFRRTYQGSRLENITTGKRDFILLFDTQDEANEHLLSSDFRIELKADLKRALAAFSPLQQRIIVRVLLQGQSVKEATKRMKGSTRKHEQWLYNTALPQLRKALAAYAPELRNVRYVPTSTPPAEEAPKPQSNLKCRFCSHVSTSSNPDTALNKLKQHIKREHPAEWQASSKYVHANDYRIRELEVRTWGTGPADVEKLGEAR